jgi:hypothetical protein
MEESISILLATKEITVLLVGIILTRRNITAILGSESEAIIKSALQSCSVMSYRSRLSALTLL